MAFMQKTSTKTMFLFLIIFFSLHYLSVSFEFQVGGNKGWVVPPANDNKAYNGWASENRFQVGDAIRFKYKKDSVMLVTQEEYKNCNSTHPIFFSNTGNTVYKFDRSGPFYFISGVSGHCQKGQKMIVKVISVEENSHDDDNNNKSSGFIVDVGVPKLVLFQAVMLFVASCLF